MNGKIFNIQKFCVNDGPGIRTTVFMKGCPLRCVWCHNPESQSLKRELMYYADKCIGCLRCIALCPNGCHTAVQGRHVFDRDGCVGCGACEQAHCGALEGFGREESVENIIREVMKDKLFYQHSGGGMTLSGGEPLSQKEFCLELLRQGKENGLHICMETCGFATEEMIRATAEYVDMYLFDYKETDPRLHKEYTGVDNALILSNLRLIDALGRDIVLRCPLIPGYNAREDHLRGIAALADSLQHLVRVEIEPYHSFGEAKYDRLGREYEPGNLGLPANEVIEGWLSMLRALTSKPVVKA